MKPVKRETLDRGIVMQAVERVEGHMLHPMHKTREALSENHDDESIKNAYTDDIEWMKDILGEAESMGDKLMLTAEYRPATELELKAMAERASKPMRRCRPLARD